MTIAKLALMLLCLTPTSLAPKDAKVTPLMSKDLADFPGKEGLMINATPFSSTTHNAQPRISNPSLVLEATNTVRQFNRETSQLLVRVTDDGKVEWDKHVGSVWERQTGVISIERVSEIRRTLKSIDTNQLHGAMGPYHVYVDTSVELHIQMTARQGEVTFSVMNPWSSSVIPRVMPKAVRAVVCEIDGLWAEVASVSIDETCKTSTSSP